MNLSELFFFKVFPCIYNENDNNYIRIHDKKNCYFYHVSKINEKGIEKIFSEDKRREPISFSKFFILQLSKLKEGYRCQLNFDTIFELENLENNFNFYIDSMPLEYPNKLKKLNFNTNFVKMKLNLNIT